MGGDVVGEGFEEWVAIVEAGSLTGAAGVLGLPRATVGRRLSRLEERLGVRLVHRTTRRLTLTAQGEALYARARRVVEAAREAEAEVRRQDGVPRGLLRVSVPVALPYGLLAGWLATYRERAPDVEVEILFQSRHVDLVAEGFDVALRTGPVDPGLVARTLKTLRMIAVASPAYLQDMPIDDLPALQAADCLLGTDPDGLPAMVWPLCDGGRIRVRGSLRTNQMELRAQAAVQGLGVALVTERLVTRQLAEGLLQRVLPDQVGRTERIAMVYPDRRFLEPKVRLFVDLFVEAFDALP